MNGMGTFTLLYINDIWHTHQAWDTEQKNYGDFAISSTAAPAKNIFIFNISLFMCEKQFS